MAVKNVLIEVVRRPEFEASMSAFAMDAGGPVAAAAADAVSGVPGITLDLSFAPVAIPALAGPSRAEARVAMAAEAEELMVPDFDSETVLLRGTIDEAAFAAENFTAGAQEGVRGIFADPVIEPIITCAGGPVGNALDVARLLSTRALRNAGMDGSGVLVAIVDTGVNLEHLRQRGLTPRFSRERSWVPPLQPGQSQLVPGEMPVGHGTMCAYDSLIAAPMGTLLDIAVLASRRPGGSAMEGLLSDAVAGYSHLLHLVRGLGRPGDFHSLVVNNSWGMFQQSWDFPRGHPGNYSHNPRHPFNLIVGTLERAGADLLFAAGNCGRECPDRRCGTERDAGIYGANSHPAVLCVAGVDVRGERVGYSTRGPGHIDAAKPDVAGYTHFDGSRVYPADGGTSAATPVVAGLVAALRSRYPLGRGRTPAVVRDLLRRTAKKPGEAGHDEDIGFGIVDGLAISRARLAPAGADAEGPDGAGTDGTEGGPTFLEALRAFGFESAEAAEEAEAGAEDGGFEEEEEMNMNGNDDQEFMQALQQFGGGAGAGAGAGGGYGMESDASFDMGTGGDNEFMQALRAFGQGGGSEGGGLESGFGGGVDVAAAPNLADVCRTWNQVRPIVMRILPFLAALPGIGTAVAAAFRTLAGLLDAICRGGGTVQQLCQRWRGGLRAIAVRIASVVGRIPFIGGAAERALRTLIAAIDAVCR